MPLLYLFTNWQKSFDAFALDQWASGSLDTAAVQLAKHFGAIVTGVCSAQNIEMVKSLGADEVIDYVTVDFTQNGQTYDIIYDAVGKSSFSKCKKSLTAKGTYISPRLGLPLLLQMINYHYREIQIKNLQ